MKIKIIIAFILLFAGIANAGDAAVKRTDYKSARTGNLVGITIKQIKQGSNGKYGVIGRSMGNAEITGVRNVYSELKNTQKLDVEIFDASSLTGLWKTKFDDALAEFAQKTNSWTTKLSNQELLQLKMYKLNKEWAQHLIDEGYTILDIGDFNNLGFSAFYAMEKATIFK